MRNFFSLLLISILSGALTLLGYTYFFQPQIYTGVPTPTLESQTKMELPNFTTPSDFTHVAQSTVTAVVHVKNVSYTKAGPSSILDYFYGTNQNSKPKAQIGMGSGVIISPDGYIVTNNHVINNASEIEITLNDNTQYKAVLIGTDKQSDIALLKIEPSSELSYLIFGDSDKIELAQWVLAVGNPFNLTSTVTAGIISAKARNLSQSGIQSFIQTDAVINPGNSGGALVNNKGELIGINTLISSNTGSYVGYGFAVPSNLTKKIVQDLMQFGNVQQAILGISGQELNQYLAKELDVQTTQGFYIASIDPNSNAQNQGLRVGDIITHIDNKKITTFIEIKNILSHKSPQDTVLITYIRDNKQHQSNLTLIKQPLETTTYKGFEFQDLTPIEKQQLGLNYGIKIKQVNNAEYAAYKNQLQGSILLSINDITIDSWQQAKSLLEQLSNKQKVKLHIISKNGQYLSLLL
ncbi:trypsin-like peptidase domain-containing protein [Myroides sp. LJL115]